jgi:hypothetical protein
MCNVGSIWIYLVLGLGMNTGLRYTVRTFGVSREAAFGTGCRLFRQDLAVLPNTNHRYGKLCHQGLKGVNEIVAVVVEERVWAA